MSTPFETYIRKVEDDLRGGKATEHTYRSSLEILIESFERGIEASNDPKHIACGAPDFIVEKRRVPLGYVETKDVGESLDKIEKTDQMKRYLKALNNLILTDYLEFRWYVKGEKKRTIRIAEMDRHHKLMVAAQAETNFTQFFHDFLATESPTVSTPKELALRLSAVTHFIREQIVAVMKSGDPALQSSFQKRFAAFKDLLLPALKEEEFADLYAQTMTYGLFAAKLSAPEHASFTLTSAYQYLFGNKFLRRLFSDVSEELDEIEIIRPYLLDIVSLLNRADFHSILADFGKRTLTEDPVVHFYETFLASYDPKLRASRGVFYTPEPAVQFIVNAVDYLLKTRFHLASGLADSSVKLLDPATGTGTFLYYVIQKIYEEVVIHRKQAGQWKQRSRELLNRIFGFELLIAPYVVSHLKLALLLKELGAPLEGRDERLHVYLTNALEEVVTRAEQLAGLGHYIAEEASDAAYVKKNQGIMVVMGNPPYPGHSANASVDQDGHPNFIGKLLREYYFVDSAPLGERNPKWLQDDYVKFIRFGEWRINQTGHGILAFITNHGYLDNPTFRGMRQHLMQSFNEIYVLDLHGNSKKKEKTPDGGNDENVFDIQQGVAIILAIKDPNGLKGPLGCVRHASLWGRREEKYAILRDSSLEDIEWTELKPEKPFYWFMPQNLHLADDYKLGWSIVDIFPVNNLGMNTHRDGLVIAFDKQELQQRITDLRSNNISDSEIRHQFGVVDVGTWKLGIARRKLASDTNWKSKIIPCLYRPFDNRWLFFSLDFIDRPRMGINQHMVAGDNLSFATTRQTREPFSVIVTNQLCGQHKIATPYDGNSIFPLYLYTTPEETQGTLFAQSETTRRPNLASTFISAFSEKLGLQFINDGSGDLKNTFGPEDVFYYAYAVFQSLAYRQRYAEFLEIDFPRLPLTGDKKLFAKLVEKGRQLVGLHLFKSPRVDDFITSYPQAGNNKVEKVMFANKKVFINQEQYFGNVPEEVWNFKVGGYQVCEKWLKDRKGRVLSGDDITHYQRVVVALKETIRLMNEIDKTIPAWPMR